VDAAAKVTREVSARPEAADGEVALVGVSTGATLALLLAENPTLEGDVSLVAGVAPYSNIETVLSVATTGHYRRSDRRLVSYEAAPFLSYVIARSMVAALPPGRDRRKLAAEIENVGRESPHPLSRLRTRGTEDLGPGAKSVVRLLANRDPERFDDLYGNLPQGVRHDLQDLSPLSGRGRIGVPVELATGPHDKYFPPSESYAIGHIAPRRRVTVTGALDHAELDASPRHIPAFLAFDGFVVRSLRTARAED